MLGPQQFYLEDMQAEMWAEGDKIGATRMEHPRDVTSPDVLGLGAMRLSAPSGGTGAAGGSRIPRVYAAPETTAPVGVQQGDYLNQQKLRRQGGAAAAGGGTVHL